MLPKVVSKVVAKLDDFGQPCQVFFMLWPCGWVAGNFQHEAAVMRGETVGSDHELSSGGCT
jgi:hypothetical protein